MPFALPTIFLILSTISFLVFERILPGRKLPNSKGWYTRALLINICQLLITFFTNKIWLKVFSGASIFSLASIHSSFVAGFLGYLISTFFFYWWHRLRHLSGWWLVFHQVHHSPTRIEVLTSFYKHPLEIFVNSILSALILYVLLGVPLAAALWYNFFAATGEYFYHSNFKSPRWLKYFIQTPELHSIHHERDVHTFNFSDLPLWDRLFGTYRDTNDFRPACGFPNNNERKLGKMLRFKDVYDDEN